MNWQKTSIYISFFIIGVVLGSLISGLAKQPFFNSNQEVTPSTPTVTVKLYDADGNPVDTSTTLAIVNGIEGVKYAAFTINMKNVGDTPLNVRVEGAEPSQLAEAIHTDTFNIPKGGVARYTTDKVDLDKLATGNVKFTLHLRYSAVYAGKERVFSKDASITMSIKPDPKIGLDVDIVGASGSAVKGVICE